MKNLQYARVGTVRERKMQDGQNTVRQQFGNENVGFIETTNSTNFNPKKTSLCK